MKTFGIVSYNIYCNFTNYGSALQSWALHRAINKLGPNKWQAALVDYCPDILKDKDPLNPMKNMWDTDTERKQMCERSLPAIKINYRKFMDFYCHQFNKTRNKYTAQNFNNIIGQENINGFVCGSDTIFCTDEFGFDDGYYANYDCMKNGFTIAYAASFGDPHFTDGSYRILNQRLHNFKAIALRENLMIKYVQEHTSVPVQKVLDPTLLLVQSDYDTICAPRLNTGKYLLLYARRHNPAMTDFAEKFAKENNWEVIEISLNAKNAEKHRMFYEAGVEEFLSLVKNAEFIVTNSFHGMILSVQYRRPFFVFSREQCDTKIQEVLAVMGISERLITAEPRENRGIDYAEVHRKIAVLRDSSLAFLNKMLCMCP